MVWSARTRRWVRWGGILVGISLSSLILAHLWGMGLVDRAMEVQKREVGSLRVLARPIAINQGEPWGYDELLYLFKALHFPITSCSNPAPFTVCQQDNGFRLGQGLGQNLEGPVELEPAPRGITMKESSGKNVRVLRLTPSLLAIVPQKGTVQWSVPLTQVSPDFLNAVVDLEDRRFLSHPGLSLQALMRATLVNLTSGGVRQGGSTITQQVVKVLLLKPERRISRKMLEAFLASLLEYKYSKREILEAYLNNVYFGQEGGIAIIGVEAASHYYFGKPARYLALGEGALLAGMIAAPNKFDPISHRDAALQRRAQALQAMVEAKHLSPEQADHASRAALPDRTWSLRWRLASHCLDLFPTERLTGEVPTTIDPVVQQAVWEGVQAGLHLLEQRRRYLAKSGDPLQVAVVVLGQAGNILGLLGSRDGRPGELNRALAAIRPIGSLVKPFLLALALEQGWSLQAPLRDEPLDLRVGDQVWSPHNHDGRFRGITTLEEALIYSVNVPMVRLGLSLGLNNVTNLLRQLGLHPSGTPAEFLGAVEATPLAVARAYTPFINYGVLVDPWAWGKPGTSQRVFFPETIRTALNPLQQVVKRGTAAGFVGRCKGPLAGKTGTTDDRRDSWFVALRPKMVTVVWVGTDQNQETGLYGASGAGLLWQEIDLRLPTVYKGGIWE